MGPHISLGPSDAFLVTQGNSCTGVVLELVSTKMQLVLSGLLSVYTLPWSPFVIILKFLPTITSLTDPRLVLIFSCVGNVQIFCRPCTGHGEANSSI